MPRKARKERLAEFYEAVMELRTVEECQAFFEDVCSPIELSAIEQRYAVAELLLQDEVYLNIIMKTKASTATISRVKRMLTDGTGCMKVVIDRVHENKAAAEGGTPEDPE